MRKGGKRWEKVEKMYEKVRRGEKGWEGVGDADNIQSGSRSRAGQSSGTNDSGVRINFSRYTIVCHHSTGQNSGTNDSGARIHFSR